MKKTTHFRKFSFLAAFFMLTAVLLTSCGSGTESELNRLRDRESCDFTDLEPGYDQNTQRNFTDEGIEFGKVVFENGDYVKYWFKSHHLAEDGGGTLFAFSDGETRFLPGYFCCEVMLPMDGVFSDRKAFEHELMLMEMYTEMTS